MSPKYHAPELFNLFLSIGIYHDLWKYNAYCDLFPKNVTSNPVNPLEFKLDLFKLARSSLSHFSYNVLLKINSCFIEISKL